MGLFGKAKRTVTVDKEESDFEPVSFPLRAYVTRTAPERYGRTEVAGRLPGHFDGFKTMNELEDMIVKTYGGGTFRARIVRADDTTQHVHMHNFTVPGVPLMNGRPVDEGEQGGRSKKRDEEDDPVEKLHKQIQVEQVQAQLDEEKAKREAQRLKLQREREKLEMGDDDDDNSTPQTPPWMTGTENPEIAQLKTSLESMQRKLEDKERESMMDKYESRIAQMQSDFNRRLELMEAKGGRSAGGEMMSAQMEAIKAVVTAGQEQTRAMLASNSELIKVMMSRDPSAGINDRVDKLVEKLFDTQKNSTAEQLAMMKDSFNTGIMMARGGEAQPTSLADVAKDFSGRVLDVASEFIKQKGQMTKETLAQEIQKATARVVENVKRQMNPAMMSQVRQTLAPPGGIPAGSAAPRSANAVPAGAQGSSLPAEEIRRRVDKIMEVFVEDMNNGTENWQTTAQQLIPPEDMARIGDFTFENVALYAMKHGSEDRVKAVLAKLEEMGFFTHDQILQWTSMHGISVDLGPAGDSEADIMAGATREAEAEVLADDENGADDEALMGDAETMVAQGDANGSAPVEPQQGQAQQG